MRLPHSQARYTNLEVGHEDVGRYRMETITIQVVFKLLQLEVVRDVWSDDLHLVHVGHEGHGLCLPTPFLPLRKRDPPGGVRTR